MLKNYFIIAIAVLKRRKFFTFISLFGISFTLTILMVVTAFINHVISPDYPEINRSKSLYVAFLRQENTKEGWANQSPGSYYYFDHYVNKMKTPDKVAISTLFAASNTYVNNKKILVNLKYTNADYWKVLEYHFSEGKAFGEREIGNSEKVAVISEQTKEQYFGKDVNAVGKYIETDNIQYRVVGVVQNVPMTMPYIYADMYLPYTVSKAGYQSTELTGNYIGILMAKSESDVPKMAQEYEALVPKVSPLNKGFDVLETQADPYLATFTRQMMGSNNDSGVASFVLIVSLLALLFMLLPTLNLININISRIMERSSEIGVRKAFGASASTLVYQFIVENVIFTFIGGAIGVLLSYIAISTINSSNLIEHAQLKMDTNVLIISFFACLVFGLLSGVYPAWRMSKLHVVNALKAS